MGKNGGKTDYSRLTSRQIAVYKTDKALLELVDSLKPAGTAYPAHIHASGEEDEEGYSLIRLQNNFILIKRQNITYSCKISASPVVKNQFMRLFIN